MKIVAFQGFFGLTGAVGDAQPHLRRAAGERGAPAGRAEQRRRGSAAGYRSHPAEVFSPKIDRFASFLMQKLIFQGGVPIDFPPVFLSFP